MVFLREIQNMYKEQNTVQIIGSSEIDHFKMGREPRNSEWKVGEEENGIKNY